MLKNLLDACFGAIGFFCIGYGLAYGDETTGTTFVGTSLFALKGMDVGDYAGFFFQFAFAATAATIVVSFELSDCLLYSPDDAFWSLTHFLGYRLVLLPSVAKCPLTFATVSF